MEDIADPAAVLGCLTLEERLAIYRSYPSNFIKGDKNCFLQRAKEFQTIDMLYVEESLEHIEKQKDFADYRLCLMVRILYFPYGPESRPLLDRITRVLRSFPFWPMCSSQKHNNTFCFWSENHAFMFLSSAHLFFQREEVPDNGETFILREVLRSKVNNRYARGLYEVLSHVYLPYTLSALLNLIDFSRDEEIKFFSNQLANMILYQFALGTTDQGVSTLTPSARTFERCRSRTWSHNLNQLMLLMTGISTEPFKPSAITGFLLTSTFRPDPDIDLVHLISSEIDIASMRMNHRADDIDYVLSTLSEEERVPFIWSAGLVTHPKFVERTKSFQSRYNLTNHPHLKTLNFLPSWISHSFMDIFSLFSKGQNYTGIVLNLYKSPGGLLLASFEDYNVGLCGYQQLPWIANISGVGVWSMSGTLRKLKSYKMTNLYNPRIMQKRKLLVAVYKTPHALLSYAAKALFRTKSQVHWPSPLFDQELRQRSRKKGNGWNEIPRGKHVEEIKDHKVPIAVDTASGVKIEEIIEKTETSIDNASIHDVSDAELVAATEHEEIMLADQPPRSSDSDADHLDQSKTIAELQMSSDDDDDEEESTSDSDDSDSDDSDSDEEEDDEVAVATAAIKEPVKAESSKKQGKRSRRIKKRRKFAVGIFNKVYNTIAQATKPKKKKKSKGFFTEWWIGRRGSALIGLCCTSKTHVDTKTKTSLNTAQANPAEQPVFCPLRVCKSLRHAWIVRVGSIRTPKTSLNCDPADILFDDIYQFAEYCKNSIYITVSRSSESGEKSLFTVVDGEHNDTVSIAVN